MIDETVEEISEMQTHSSSVVAVKAAQALRDLTDREYPTVEDYLRSLDRNSSALRRANPSHASLHTTQHKIVTTVSDADPDDVATAKELTTELSTTLSTRWSRRKTAPLHAPCRRSPTTTCC